MTPVQAIEEKTSLPHNKWLGERPRGFPLVNLLERGFRE